MRIWKYDIKRKPSGFVDIMSLILIGAIVYPFYCTISNIEMWEIVYVVSGVSVILIVGELCKWEIKNLLKW